MKLKNCPFCGEEADFDWHVDTSYCVKCTQCGASVKYFETPEEAKKVWNKRAKKQKNE